MDTAWANELNATHIGEELSFKWHFPGSNVKALIEGELQEVLHDTSSTYLTLVGEGGSDGEQFRLEHRFLVVLPKREVQSEK